MAWSLFIHRSNETKNLLLLPLIQFVKLRSLKVMGSIYIVRYINLRFLKSIKKEFKFTFIYFLKIFFQKMSQANFGILCLKSL